MKGLIVRDTHGQRKELREVMKRERPFDSLIHCGDTEGLEEEIRKEADCPCTIVRGNNDFGSDLPFDEVIYRLGHRIFVTHGHRYSVAWNLESLKSAARAHGCDMVIYGHTHRPLIDSSDPGLIVMNPGSLAYPRQEGRQPSYIVAERDESGKVDFRVEYLKKKAVRRYFW